MTDKPKGAIAPHMAAPTKPHNSTDAAPPPNCVACGQYHGSVGVAKTCLEIELLRLRALVPLAGRYPDHYRRGTR